MLDDATYEFIKKEYTFLLVQYNIVKAPVSGWNLAQKMDIPLKPYSTLPEDQKNAAFEVSEDGFLYIDDGEPYIYYNDNKKRERINYTILHEIGHYVLDHTGHSDKEEEEADFFAKYAIAPPSVIKYYHLKNPDEIHEFFLISYQAAQYAYNYYRKRCIFGPSVYTDYERTIIKQLCLS